MIIFHHNQNLNGLFVSQLYNKNQLRNFLVILIRNKQRSAASGIIVSFFAINVVSL